MKKLILMMLLVVGGVMTANADGEIYLRNNISSTWATDDPNFKSNKTWDGKQDIYEFTIDASTLGENDFYFRINRYNSDGKLICPYNHEDYIFKFENGKYEEYTAPRVDKFQGDNGAFCIKHSTIKANQYKITIYLKYNDKATVDGTEYNNIWVYYIKVEIVSMPAKVSSIGYSTFSCDRALDLDNATGVTAYKASVNDVNKKVVLTKVTGKVAAGTGLLLAGATGTIPVVTTSEGTDISESNLLKATVTEQTVSASSAGTYHYFLAGTSAEDIGFYNLASNATSGAGKAYLETTTELASDANANGSRAAWIFLEDETTGIHAVQNSENVDVIYDLQGRVAKNGKAGLYIKNGKKFFVK